MEISLDTLQTVDREAWDARLLRAPETSIWQTARWAAITEAFLKMEPQFLMVRDEAGEVLAQLLFVIQVPHHRFFIERPVYSRFLGLAKHCFPELHWLDGPVVFDKGSAADIIKTVMEFLEDYTRHHGILAHRGVRLPIYWNDDVALAEADTILRIRGYERKDWATFVVDLHPPIEELWRNLKGNVRTAIRKCGKQGVSIHKDSTGERLTEYQKILEEDRRRIGERVFSQDKLALREHLSGSHSDWQLYYAAYKDEMVGGMMTVTFNGNTLHVGLCRSDFCREQRLEVYYGLMWEIIRDSKEEGYARYDLGGVNPKPHTPKEHGIYAFKGKWGGQFIQYSEYTKVYRPNVDRVAQFFRNSLRGLGIR